MAKQNLKPSKVLFLTVVGVQALNVPQVLAQSEAQPRELSTIQVTGKTLEYRQFERVEITGSSIIRKEQTKSLPVLSITREDIQRSGKTTVTEVVHSMPSMSNFIEAAQLSTSAGGYATGTIHGFTNGTLILINGRRLAPYGLQTMAGPERSAVSLNTIPLADVERIEVLSDGASSLYGTDAIAGVINIIMRTERQGFEINVLNTTPDQNKGVGRTAQLGWGAGRLMRDGYSVLLSAEISQQDALLGQDRPYASQGIIPFTHQGKSYVARGTADYITLSTAPASLFQGTQGVKYASDFSQNGECVGGTIEYVPSAGNTHCRRNGYLSVGIYPKQEAQKLHASTQVLMGSGHKWFAEGFYGQMEESRPTNLWPSTTVAVSTNSSSADNKKAVAAGLTPSRTTMFWRPDLASLSSNKKEKNWQLTTGLQGEYSGWDYKTSAYYSQSKAEYGGQTVSGNDYRNLSDFTRANLLTPLNDSNPLTAQLQALLVNPVVSDQGKTALSALELRGSRSIYEIDGKDVFLGAGLDWRSESTAYENLTNIDAPASFEGKRKIIAAYSELAVPVRDNLDLNFALRHDVYSDVGSTTNGKVSSRWAINSKWAVRGAWGTGFRAPTVGQLQKVDNDFRWGFSSYTNPCTAELIAIATGLKNEKGQAGRCVAEKIDFLGNGNPNLKPEKSTQETLGLAFTPNSNLRLSMDFWRVNITDAITYLSDREVLKNPSLYESNFVLNSGNKLALYLPLQNTGELIKSGLDLEAQWRYPTDYGRLTITGQGTYMLSSKQKKTQESDYSSDLGQFSDVTSTVIPKFKSRITSTLSTGDLSMSLAMNYVSSYKDADISAINVENQKTETITGRKVNAFKTWDINAQYVVNKWLDLKLAVFNVLNKEAPLSFSETSKQVFGANTINSQLWGRTVQIGMTLRY